MMPHFFVQLSTCVPNSTSVCVSTYVCPFVCMPKCLPVSMSLSLSVYFFYFLLFGIHLILSLYLLSIFIVIISF